MKTQGTEFTQIDCIDILHSTDAAVLVIPKATCTEMWIPLSQVHSIHRDSAPKHLFVATWLAKKKGLI